MLPIFLIFLVLFDLCNGSTLRLVSCFLPLKNEGKFCDCRTFLTIVAGVAELELIRILTLPSLGGSSVAYPRACWQA
jgi:hypothetical protein